LWISTPGGGRPGPGGVSYVSGDRSHSPFFDRRSPEPRLPRRFNAALVQSEGIHLAALAQREGVGRSYFTQNAQEIARLAGDLCDKISMSLGDLNVVAEKMNGALAAHNEAVKRLSTGRGNALSVGERIRGLGVKTKRPLPAMLVDGLAITSEAEEFEASGIAAAAE